jgi:histidinol dehydrogenase
LSRIDLRGVAADSLTDALPGLSLDVAFPSGPVREILDEVRHGGDEAVRELTLRFDKVDIADSRVPQEEVQDALERIDPDLKKALKVAYQRILDYHRHEQAPLGVFSSGSLTVEHILSPMRRAGLYAPGGRAKYPSTVLMCAVPAQVAGVGELVLCVPPSPDGHIAVETLAAAAIAGVGEVRAVGGAQAIAAMAYGTATLKAVDVIVGPGNSYVAEAKRQLSGVVGVPSAFAGPSEVVVVADGSIPVTWTAVDLVVQAEHGPDGLAWLITWSESVADEVSKAVDEIVAASPRRADLESTLASGGYAVLVDGPEQAMAVANHVAPEHLELQTSDPRGLLALVKSAGAVFLGPYSPASVGDYVAGPNHVLPTARTARFSSALRVDDFRTHIHAVTVDSGSLEELAPHVIAMAEAEGLPAHAESVRLRFPPPTTEGS